MDCDFGEMEMDYYRESVWELSNFKKAQWTPRNDLMISKKTTGGGMYKIFVIPEACQGILDKQKELWTIMDDVKKGIRSNPVNIEVANLEGYFPRIVQISVYNGYPKFGLHILDEHKRITMCKGLNLTPTEFEKLLEMLVCTPPIIPTPTKPTISLTQFSWSWKLTTTTMNNEDIHLAPISNGKWYLDSEICFYEALEAKPEGSYFLETNAKTFEYKIDDSFLDAALARLILHNIGVRKGYEAMKNAIPENGDDSLEGDLRCYGNSAYRDVHIHQLYYLFRKLIALCENSRGLMYTTAMDEIAKRGKTPNTLELLKKKGSSLEYLNIFEQIDL